jgi:hypothetical protein
MKKSLLAFAAGLALAGPAAALTAVNFDNEFSGGTDCATPVTGCSVLTASPIAGGVHFDFYGTMVATEFITGLYGNFNSLIAPTVANLAGDIGTIGGGFSFGIDSFKADGDGFFDWKLDFKQAPPGSRFDGTDHISWDFLGLPLSAYGSLSVNGPEGKTGFLFATHAQGLVEGGSGWFNGQLAPGTTPFDVTPVPEPETYALFAAGLAMLALMNKRRKKGGVAHS